LGFAGTSYINADGTNDQLMIERDGALIRAYANGQLLETITDNSFIGNGRIGLIASTFDYANVDARFDNFEVCSFSGPLTTLGQSAAAFYP
jgi:hypothetical protein